MSPAFSWRRSRFGAHPSDPFVAEPDAGHADWWLPELTSWSHGRPPLVASFVPAHLPAVCRVLHRWTDAEGAAVTWEAAADRMDVARVPDIDGLRDRHGILQEPGRRFGLEATVGELDRDTANALVPILCAATSTPDDVFIAVWKGYGGRPQRRFPGAAHLPTEARGHFLVRGSLADILEWRLQPPFPGVVPGYWWPEDRAWFLATEIDYEWTFLAGEQALIDAVESHPELEAWPTAFDAPANRVDLSPHGS